MPIPHPSLRPELATLEQQYSISYDAADRTVVVEDVAVPRGYTPTRITVRFKLPATYPQAAPRAELPWNLRFHGRVPRHLLSSGQWLIRGRLGDPLIYFPADWSQDASLRTVLADLFDDLTVTAEETPERTDA